MPGSLVHPRSGNLYVGMHYLTFKSDIRYILVLYALCKPCVKQKTSKPTYSLGTDTLMAMQRALISLKMSPSTYYKFCE